MTFFVQSIWFEKWNFYVQIEQWSISKVRSSGEKWQGDELSVERGVGRG